MAFQVKVEYGGKRFATFLLENVSYDGLVSSIRKNCSSLAHLDADKIRLRYRDEDGDMVNVCQADLYAFSEMLCMVKEVEDRNYKKIFIQANEIDSLCQHKIKRVDFGMENPSTGNELSCHFVRQLFRQQVSLKTLEGVPHQLKMTCKDVARYIQNNRK